MGRIRDPQGSATVGVNDLAAAGSGTLQNRVAVGTVALQQAPLFILSFPVTAVATETIVTAANNDVTFSVLGAGFTATTAGGATENIVVSTATAGAGTVIATFDLGATTTTFWPSGTTGVGTGAIRLVAGTDGIFLNKENANTAVGTINLYCVKS